MPDISTLMALFLAGIAAGVSNAIAGGGTFFTFPVFLAAGIPPVIANASNAIAVWPGHAMAAIGFRKELVKIREQLWMTLFLALLGGLFGAYLLSIISNSWFTKLIPFLILFATLLFAYGETVASFIKSNITINSSTNPYLKRIAEFAFASYGGFFGAGYGIMLMAWLQISSNHDLQTTNALKNLIATIVSSVAVIVFIFSGIISWWHTGAAFGGAIIGGLIGTKVIRVISAQWLSRTVITFGLLLSIYYLLKYYG